MAEKSKFSKENFVSKVVTDPNNVPDTLLLGGYLGASSQPNSVRLYFDPELSNYVEIPEDAILHTQDQTPEASPPGASFVWIKKDAVLTHKTSASTTKAKFLDGPIVRQFAQAAVPQPQGVTLVGCPTQAVCVTHLDCPPPTATCPTRTPCVTHPACPPLTIACPSHTPCLTLACPTHQLCPPPTAICPTHAPCVIHTINPPCVVPTISGPACHPTLVTCQTLHNCPTLAACSSIHICPTVASCPSIHICQTLAACPSINACETLPACPSIGVCPSIACGLGGGGVINPAV